MQSSEAASRCWAAMVKASRDAMPVPTATPSQQLLRVVPVVDTTPTDSRWDWKTYVAYCFCIACAGLTKRLCRLICRYNAALQTRELGHTVLYSDVLGSTQTILDGYGTVDVCLLASGWRVVSHAPMCRVTQELSVAEVHSSRRRPGGGCRATASRPRYVCSAQCLIMQAPYVATYTWQGVVPTSGCPPWGVCPSRCTSECHGPMCSCSTWWWSSVEAPEGHATRAVVRYACPLAAVEAIKSLEGGYSVRVRGVVMSAFAGSHRLCCSNLISG